MKEPDTVEVYYMFFKSFSYRFSSTMRTSCVFLGVVFGLTSNSVGAATTQSITSGNITWKFGKAYEYGQFVTGDFWVVDPGDGVILTGVTQPYSRGRDGSMVNPIPDLVANGYDSRVAAYTDSLNVATQLPYTLKAGDSLVSTISRVPSVTVRSERRPALQDGEVLTVVDSPRAVTDFRPPYAAATKTIHSSIGMKTNIVELGLAPVSDTPSLSAMESSFGKPWIDNVIGWQGDDLHPANNLPNYGAGIARNGGVAVLRTLLNDKPSEKLELIIGIVQVGIDQYGLVEAGAYWGDVGGTIGVGRKLPILFAGLMLDDDKYKNVAKDFDTRRIFQEDGQTFYLTQAERDGTKHTKNAELGSSYYFPKFYDAQPDGTACWGDRHYRWLTTGYVYLPGKPGYRAITASSTKGVALAVRLLGIEHLWNHDPFLDFQDRATANSIPGVAGDFVNSGWDSSFVDAMWSAYRSNIPERAGQPPLSPLTNIPESAGQPPLSPPTNLRIGNP